MLKYKYILKYKYSLAGLRTRDIHTTPSHHYRQWYIVVLQRHLPLRGQYRIYTDFPFHLHFVKWEIGRAHV